jgi:hypothetical protein
VGNSHSVQHISVNPMERPWVYQISMGKKSGIFLFIFGIVTSWTLFGPLPGTGEKTADTQ